MTQGVICAPEICWRRLGQEDGGAGRWEGRGTGCLPIAVIMQISYWMSLLYIFLQSNSWGKGKVLTRNIYPFLPVACCTIGSQANSLPNLKEKLTDFDRYWTSCPSFTCCRWIISLTEGCQVLQLCPILIQTTSTDKTPPLYSALASFVTVFSLMLCCGDKIQL